MRWEDERYVMVYTRDTLTMLRLEWQGRAVLAELFRKVDRAGLLEIGDADPVEALALMLRMPPEVVAAGWERLTTGKDPVVTLRDGTSRAVFIPNFLAAQEAKHSDKVRQQKHRELAAARKTVTPRDEPSRLVTERHAESHAVTPCHSSLAETSLAVEDQSTVELPKAATATELAPPRKPKVVDPRAEHVFGYWAKNRPRAIFSPKRRRKVEQRLAEGYTVELLCRAIDGCDKRGPIDGKVFDDLELVCRDVEHVDMFLRLADPPVASAQAPRPDGFVFPVGHTNTMPAPKPQVPLDEIIRWSAEQRRKAGST